MRLILTVILVGMVGCSSPSSAEDVAMQRPPAVTINDVEGTAVSWCWEDCVDGFVNSGEILNHVDLPLVIDLPPEAQVEAVTADGQQVDSLEQVPDQTDLLSVTLRWENGNDASYYWTLRDR